MIRGKDKPFVAGKPFTFFADLSPEQKRRDKSKTRFCFECDTQKPKTHFALGSEWCRRCEDKD